KCWNNEEKGIYYCAGCGTPLFDSKIKFKSGSGWPSFSAPIKDSKINEAQDVHNFIRELNEKEFITKTNSNMVLKEYKNSSIIL
ncbi:unnamed protein product, partial [marine sediment metagenome]